jgi:acyl carrier protein
VRASATVVDRLTGVFREVFRDPGLVIAPATTAGDVRGWDSFGHLNLIVAIEAEFDVSFTTRELGELQSVGDMIDLLSRRMGLPRP